MTDEERMVAEHPLMPEEAVEVEDYIFGDLYIKCSCGNDTLEMAGIEGLQITMPATNRDCVDLHCPSCGHQLKLYYRRAENIEELMIKRDAMLEAMSQLEAQFNKVETNEAEENSVEVNEEESTERE